MREEIVSYLENNAVDDEGFPLLEFLPEFTSWEEYLETCPDVTLLGIK